MTDADDSTRLLRAAEALLRWQRSLGIDDVVAADARRRQNAAPVPAPAPQAPTPRRAAPKPKPTSTRPRLSVAPSPPSSPSSRGSGSSFDVVAASESAEAAARSAETLDALGEAISAFDGCPLKRAARRSVFCDGDPRAPLMVIGEAPGATEEELGKPFVGRAGRLLDRMLSAIGIARDADDPREGAFISNAVFWRPPGNRAPTPSEIASCLPFVLRAAELAAPKVILLVGGVSAKTLLDDASGITRLRGRWRVLDVGGREIPTMPTFHPAFLLRQPRRKREAWKDLRMLRRRLDEESRL